MLVRLGIYGPVLIAAGLWALRSAHLGALPFAGTFAAGILLWTALEYLMHRFAFHGFAPHWQHHERLRFWSRDLFG